MFFSNLARERWLYRLFYGGLFAFILTLNLLMLPVADEWAQWAGRPIQGSIIDFVYNSYLTWNARIGELLFRIFMFSVGDTPFQQQLIFGVINTFVFCGFLANLFYLVRGYYPKAQKKDALLVVFLFTALYYGSFFNESFIWQSGGMNYGWALFFASCWALPYRHYLANTPPKKIDVIIYRNNLSIKEILKALGFFMVSIPVGMGGEILSPCLCFGLFLFLCHEVFIQKRIPPLWFFAGGLGIFAGWILLVTAPGPHKRRQYILSKNPDFMKFSFTHVFSGFWKILSSREILCSMVPLLLECLATLKKRSQPRDRLNFRNLALLSVGFLGLVMGVFVGIPSRTYITFTVFFVLALAFIFESPSFETKGKALSWVAGFAFLFLLKLSPLEPHIRTLITLGSTFYLILLLWSRKFFIAFKPLIVFLFLGIVYFNIDSYISFHRYLKGHFTEIQRQKDSGIEEIKITAPYIWYYRGTINMGGFISEVWVLDPLANYYKVKSIDFINPKTGKSYRNLDT